MVAYPSVNWWPGNLRSYESRLSFLVRFRQLNGITARRCLEFLNIPLAENTLLRAGEIARLSSLLHEAFPAVAAAFAPSVLFINCGRYAPPVSERYPHHVGYCETCAQHGYHSYLHETYWLAKCPFHMTELKKISIANSTTSVAVRKMAALDLVMRENCKTWPHGVDNSFPAEGQGQAASLERWVTRAEAEAARLSDGEIWLSGDDPFLGPVPLRQIFGQLRTLVPIPEEIEPLFAEPGGRWSMEVRSFPPRVRTELDRLSSRLSFDRIFGYYKRISAWSGSRSSFVTRLKAVQDLLKARHGSCTCEWKQVNTGWEAYWINACAGEERRDHACPFEIALNELELGWGRSDRVLSSRKAEDERLRIAYLSSDMHDAGLINYKRGVLMSPDGHLIVDQDTRSACEWILQSPLTELLDVAACWEIESAYEALSEWLDNIEQGLHPGQRDDSKYCVRLREADNGLSLVRWSPVRSGNVS